jgi:arylsulfatase A-like enzyme
VGRIRSLLEQREQWDDTLFVVTSDHGEAFFEHGLARHDLVPFEEVLRVPLVVSWPRAMAGRAGHVLTNPAWHIDLFPTLLSLAGVAAPRAGAGSDLSPAILGASVQQAERSLFPLVLRPAHRGQEPGRRVALRGNLKRIDGHPDFGDPTGLLFDLHSDPGEGQNLRSQRPGEWRELQDLTTEWEQGLRPTAPVHQNTGRPLRGGDDERALSLPVPQQEELRALGYAE